LADGIGDRPGKDKMNVKKTKTFGANWRGMEGGDRFGRRR